MAHEVQLEPHAGVRPLGEPDHYECFVYERSSGSFLPYRGQEVVNVFFLPSA